MTCLLLTSDLAPEFLRLGDTLSANGFEVEQGLDQRHWQSADCILSSPELYLEHHQARRNKPIVVLATAGTVAEAVRCMRLGASDYLEAPVTADALAAAVERAIKEHSQRAQLATSVATPPLVMVGECLPMLRLLDQINNVADSQSAVLIVGEPGSGKELIARSVHANSDRAIRPMITLNCAAVPAALLEEELFGSMDAQGEQRLGLLQAAEGGTLFLDEVAELPLAAQSRLLQLLNEGSIRPLGASEKQSIDVRLLAATSRPMDKLVAGEQFREDLYYRLSVFTLNAPPLRDRGDDILRLAETFLQKNASRLNRTDLQFSADAKERMLQYHWPGNVRELDNAVERAVILAESAEISIKELAISSPKELDPAPVDDAEDQTSLEDYFVKFVTEHQDQLTETELAERLGISRKSLWERRQRLNIPRKKTKKRGPRRDSS